MHSFNAPYCTGNDTIASAIQSMKAHSSPAIVVDLEQQKYLFNSRAVFRGYSYGLEFCDQLDKQQGFLLKDVITRTKSKDLTASYGQQANIEKKMDQVQADYGLLNPSKSKRQDTVLVVTRHESYMARISGTNIICVCGGPNRHLIESTEDLNGEKCRICGHLYTCTTSI